MKLHPRVKMVKKAELKLLDIFIKGIEEIDKSYDLTYGEYLRIITNVFSGELNMIAKYMIREERHPNDPDKKGDLK
jgi:hypothetical protein